MSDSLDPDITIIAKTPAKLEKIDPWQHMGDAGDRPVPWKPQLVRGGWIFTCPLCGEKINSHHYTCTGAFEDACRNHLEEKHFRACIHWDLGSGQCELESHAYLCGEFDRRAEAQPPMPGRGVDIEYCDNPRGSRFGEMPCQ
jgi:hypothetical protein